MANVTRNPCKLYPYSQTSGSSTISRGPGECLCSSRTCLCTRKYALALYTALLVSNRQVASIVRFERRRPASSVPNASPRFRQTVGALLTVSTTRALPAVTVKPSLPGQWQPTCLRAHLPPCDQERIFFFFFARRHHGLYGEGIVDIPEN